MKKIDLDKLKKFQGIVDTLSRSIPINDKRSRCNKEIFVHRYFQFITNKCYKLKINGVVYYALFIKRSIKSSSGDKYSTNGINYFLGNSTSEYEIDFINEKLQLIEIKLHYNDIMDMEFKQIEMSEYQAIMELFK